MRASKDIHAGDYLLVQFGTNDSNRSATYELNGQSIPYYLDPETDFKSYLMKYIDGARQHDATPVLVTPPPRNSAYCTGGNGVAAYAQAMRELASAQQVLLSELNQQAVDYLKAICPAPDPPDFYLRKERRHGRWHAFSRARRQEARGVRGAQVARGERRVGPSSAVNMTAAAASCKTLGICFCSSPASSS